MTTPTHQSKLHRRWRYGLFILLLFTLVGTLGYLSLEFRTQWDLSQNSRNSLSQTSIDLLNQLDGPLFVTVYATQQDLQLGDIRGIINTFISTYQRFKSDLILDFIDPTEQPQQAEKAGVKLNGEIILRFEDRTERLTTINEQSFANALMRLARTSKKQLLALTNHGERKINGVTQRDLGNFNHKLLEVGFESKALSFIDQTTPLNTDILVIASPQTALLEGEVAQILDYLTRGGNLLWLVDTGSLHGLQPLAEKLGIVFTPGAVIDPQAEQLNLPLTFALGTHYSAHAVTANFDYITVFPFARQLIVEEDGWHSTILTEVAAQGWVKTNLSTEQQNEVNFDEENDVAGPISIAVALTRIIGDREQRVIVVGNGHFLANSYLGNGGNLDLGINMINWLAGDEAFISIQPRSTIDSQLTLSEQQLTLIAASTFIVLPLIFLICGFFISWYRKRR